MEIHFGRSPFVEPVTNLLRELSQLGFFTTEYPMSKAVKRAVETSCHEAAISLPGGIPWLRRI